MVSNSHKPVDDKALMDEVRDKRTHSHNKVVKEANEDIIPGSNVLLKADLTKLSSRKPLLFI